MNTEKFEVVFSTGAYPKQVYYTLKFDTYKEAHTAYVDLMNNSIVTPNSISDYPAELKA